MALSVSQRRTFRVNSERENEIQSGGFFSFSSVYISEGGNNILGNRKII